MCVVQNLPLCRVKVNNHKPGFTFRWVYWPTTVPASKYYTKRFFGRSDMYGTKRTIISLCLLSAESTLPNWPTGGLLTQFLNIQTLGFGRLSSFRLYNPPNHHYLDFLMHQIIIIQTSWSDTLPQFRLQNLIIHHQSDFNIWFSIRYINESWPFRLNINIIIFIMIVVLPPLLYQIKSVYESQEQNLSKVWITLIVEISHFVTKVIFKEDRNLKIDHPKLKGLSISVVYSRSKYLFRQSEMTTFVG